MIEIPLSHMDALRPLFAHSSETMLQSCFEGHHGKAYADRLTHPACAMVVVSDLTFFAGDHTCAEAETLVRSLNDLGGKFYIAVPEHDGWSALIERTFSSAKKIERYAIRKQPDIFDTQKLAAFARTLPTGYQIRRIDGELYRQALALPNFKDFVANFDSQEDFLRRGIGFCALHEGEIVAGASSFTVYNGGIELQVDTHEHHRRKGLATACCATLILECLKEDRYPSWDAANLSSVALASKLGYQFDRTYTCYLIPIVKKGSALHIRPIGNATCHEIYRIMEREWGGTLMVTRGHPHDLTAQPGLVCLEGEKVLGFATYRIASGACEITSLFSAEQGKGVGGALIGEITEEAAAAGCTRILAITTNDNTHAIRFYQRRGFSLARVYIGSVDQARLLKPSIPPTGYDDIPIRDELEFELKI